MTQIKEATVYKLNVHADLVIEKLIGGLNDYAFKPCTKTQESSRGFTPIEDNYFVMLGDQFALVRYKIEEKILPKSVVEHYAEKRIVAAEEKLKKSLSRQEKDEIKDAVKTDLLVKAFSIYKTIDAYIDTKNNWLVIGSCNSTHLDQILSSLRQAVSGFSSELLATHDNPSLVMTTWIFENKLDLDELHLGDSFKISDGEGSITCRKEDLHDQGIIELCTTRQVKQLSLKNEYFSFEVNEHLQIKKLKLEDAYTEHIHSSFNDQEIHICKVNTFITQQTISKIMNTLIQSFGGLVEKKKAA